MAYERDKSIIFSIEFIIANWKAQSYIARENILPMPDDDSRVVTYF